MLMAMAFCHILPEADMMFSEYQAAKEVSEKPVIQNLGETHNEEEGHDDDDHDAEEGEGLTEEKHDDHKGHDDHKEEGGHGFPWAHVLFLVGFVLMLCLDKVLFAKAEISVGKN
jgi:hypothetical protein